MERGYVKLWRKSLDSRVFQNPELWQLWTWCLLRAAHKAHWLSVSTGRGRTEIELQPGQLVFGSNVAAAALGQAPRTTLKRLHKLARMGCCTLKNCDHFTVITITNWSTYQPVALGEHEPQGEAKATEGPGNGQARATDKNGGQEEKEETSRGEPAESSLSVGVEASKQPRLEHEAGSISSIPEAAKSLGDADDASVATTESVGDRSFRLQDGVWVDQEATGGQTVKVKYLSPLYFAILRELPELRGALALGERVRAKVGNLVLEIGPDGAADEDDAILARLRSSLD